jgi:hypothetical protein
MGVLLNYLKHAKLINGRKLLSQEVFAEAQVLLGSTRFSYQWHSIPPKGWEPFARWLYSAVCQLRSLTATPDRCEDENAF